MSKMQAGVAGAVLSVFFAAGCGSTSTAEQSSLVGSWTETVTQNGAGVTDTVHLNGDGSASWELSVASSTQGVSCSGSFTITGSTWTSTGTDITLSESNAKCSGTITCAGVPIDCSTFTAQSGTCGYTLSDDDATLTLTCTGDGGTSTVSFKRED